MASFAKSSTSSNMSINSDSENEIQNNVTFNSVKLNFNKTYSPFKTSLVSNLSRQTSNNSLKYFKKLKNKQSFHESELQHDKYSMSSSYSLRSSKTKSNLPKLKTKLNYKKKKHNLKNTSSPNSNYIDVNKEFANAFESSSDSNSPDIKYLKLISKNEEISTSSAIRELKQSKSYLSLTNEKHSTINSSKNHNTHNNYLESSMSSSSFELSQANIGSNNFNKRSSKELNLDELLSDCSMSDCSLSDILFVRKNDVSNRNSLFYPTSDIDDSLLQLKKTPTQSPLPSNVSLGVIDELPLQPPSNIIIDIPDLINENEQNQTINEIEIDKQKTNNENLKVNQSKSSSSKINLNELEPISNSLKLVENCIYSESHSKCHNKLKSNFKKTNHNISKKKRKEKKSQKELKRSCLKTLTNTPKVFKKSLNTKKIKNNIAIEDIGLLYDTDKDNYMVELPNGAVVPAFLATLKPKHVKTLCVCGITKSEIPSFWSESFHEMLHINIYKLRFKGKLPENDVINFKQNDFSYKIVMLCTNNYNDKNIKQTIKDVNDFVSLEYGISETGVQLYEHSTYLAVLPNLKIIGYLKVKPIQAAYTLINDEHLSENTVPAKFGVLKIWVLIKYRNSNVDVNLLETFREKENIKKEDMAFSLCGCPNVQFIQKYTENKNALIFNKL